MVSTSIVGVGMTPVSEHWGLSLRELAAEAAQKALANAGLAKVDAIYVANAYGSTFNGQTHLGALIADYIGLNGIEAYVIEAGDASGGVALRTAHMAVLSGLVRTAMVIGVEKATDIVGPTRTRARTISLDADYEAIHGATLPALAALLMIRYMHEYGIELSAFEGFSINAHANGKLNEFAMYRNTIREGAFVRAPMVADPVNLFDNAPDGDGAAAVIITDVQTAQDLVPAPVQIVGSSVATDTFMLQERNPMLELKAVGQSTKSALSQASVTVADIDLYEAHDAFTILTSLSLEAVGFARQGEGWKLGNANSIGLRGQIPISTFGGLKSRGNPAGATGVYQAVEAVLQLRHDAGANQVENAQTAMIQNMGGLGSTVATHILRI